jgi:hypothetical protein
MERSKAVVSVDFGANDKSLTSGTLNFDVWTSLLVLLNVLPGAHYFAERSCFTSNSLEFLTVHVVVVQGV